MKENSAHSPKITNIQLEVKENSAHNSKVTNIQLEVKKMRIALKEQTFNEKSKKIGRTTLK